MAILSRKLLIVQKDDGTWRVMLERSDKTMTLQCDDAIGQEIMNKCTDIIIDIGVQRGLVHGPTKRP